MPASPAPVVETAAGALGGLRQPGLCIFRAVPYAKPPVGPLRFAAPQPVEPWSGMRDCTQIGASPPQGPSRLDAVMGVAPFAQSEDCLTLTVWTPACDDRKRPVLFWLHGGAFMSGGGHQPFYDGAQLARAGDMVVVSINYRLGALGYLYLPEIEAAGGTRANRGLLDQMQALRWVHENIARFGGDPQAITVTGQSAGGNSVWALLADPGSRAMIARAISQSGSFEALGVERASVFADAFHKAAGVARGDVAALRTLSPAQIVAAHRSVVMDLAAAGDRTLPWQMIATGPGCPGVPAQAIRDGTAKDIPILLGTTLDEGHAWLAQDDRLVAAATVADLPPAAAAALSPEALADLPADRRNAARPWQVLSANMTWTRFERPARQLCNARARHDAPTWLYRFDWRPTPDARFGACHCIELPFVFDNLAGWPPAAMMTGHDPASFQRLAAAMQGAWIAFARTGDPSTGTLPAWPRWTAATRATMIFDDTLHLEQG